jgi:hypothetical protein
MATKSTKNAKIRNMPYGVILSAAKDPMAWMRMNMGLDSSLRSE